MNNFFTAGASHRFTRAERTTGGSHDRTDLLPLKAGVALMALGAMEHIPNLQVRIVPVGLSYFHPHRFRSRAVVEFGAALDIPKDLVDQFSKGGDEKRKASGKLLDMIYDSLKTVTIRAPDYETLMVSSICFASGLVKMIYHFPRLFRRQGDCIKHLDSI